MAKYESEYGGGPGIGETDPDGNPRTLSARELALKARHAGIRDNGISAAPVTEKALGEKGGPFGEADD